MASRPIVEQQNRGEAIVPGAIKPKNMVAKCKNRRALGDIGNVVTVRGPKGKPIPQVSRPFTRSFCAQLLANAQSKATNNNKVAIVVDGALPEKRGAARKPVQKKAAIKPKPKPDEIIEISPDTNEKPEEKSLKKKGPTLSSTLSARSKAACGISNKPKPAQTVDIDAADVDNDLAVVEYVDEIYKFYKSIEHEGRANYYMDSQPEINEKMRAILIDWLIQVHHKFDLSPETLYLTINILDRYLASKTTLVKELQLLGIGSMLIASKYEEIWAPQVDELMNIADRTYTNNQVLVMEKRILGELEWNLTVPTPYMFLVRFIKASMTDSVVENMTYFLAELGMMNYETFMYCPSMIAASAVYAARCTVNVGPVWNETLKLHTGFAESQLIDCAKLLVSFHSIASGEKLRRIYKKYSSSKRGAVALLPAAKSLLAHLATN